MKSGHTAYRSTARVVLVTACILTVPLIAMQVTNEVRWSPFDFLVAGALLIGTGLAFEFLASRADSSAYRLAAGVTLGTVLMLVWANLAVGIIGDEGNPANLMYYGVLGVGILGAIIARLQPRGMARALFATAIAQALVAGIALSLGLGAPANGRMEILAPNGFFVALFVLSAWLFQRAEQKQASAGTVPRR